MIYEIAGLKVEMSPEFPRLKRQSEQYQSSGEPVLRLNPNLHSDYELCDCTDEDREYIVSSALFCSSIIPFGRFFLHASAVVLNGEAYLFSAPSGSGKSTHTALWLKQFSGSYILNDDKPVIYPKNKGVSVFGTPFAGKTDIQINHAVPLKAICFLSRGEENRIIPVNDERAVALILNNTYRPKNIGEMNILLDMIENVVKAVDIFEMTCKNELAAAEMSYKAMKGKGL